MKNKTVQTLAGFAVYFASCAIFAAVLLGFLGFFD